MNCILVDFVFVDLLMLLCGFSMYWMSQHCMQFWIFDGKLFHRSINRRKKFLVLIGFAKIPKSDLSSVKCELESKCWNENLKLNKRNLTSVTFLHQEIATIYKRRRKRSLVIFSRKRMKFQLFYGFQLHICRSQMRCEQNLKIFHWSSTFKETREMLSGF